MAFISFFGGFIGLSLGSALVQNQNNNTLTYSSVFYLNIFLGAILILIFQLSAHYIATYFQISELETIIRLLTVGFFFNAFGVVQSAILTLELRFKELNLINLVSSSLSGVLGVTLAYSGYGVYALVIQSLASGFISTYVLWQFSRWRPELVFSLQSLKKLTSFSTYKFLSDITSEMIGKTNTLIIAKLFSPSTLGYFTRANSLNQNIIRYTSGTLNKVIFSVLSQFQNNSQKLRKLFLQLIRFTSFTAFFLSGITILNAKLLIITLFGAKWEYSIYIFQILAIRITNYPINSIINNFFWATGKAKEIFWYGNFRRLLRLIPFIVAFYYNFDYFLYSLVFISVINTFFNLIISSYHNNIPFYKHIIEIYKFALIFLLSVGVIWILPSSSYNNNLIFSSLLNTSIFIILYLIGSFSIDKVIFIEVKWLIQKSYYSIKNYKVN